MGLIPIFHRKRLRITRLENDAEIKVYHLTVNMEIIQPIRTWIGIMFHTSCSQLSLPCWGHESPLIYLCPSFRVNFTSLSSPWKGMLQLLHRPKDTAKRRGQISVWSCEQQVDYLLSLLILSTDSPTFKRSCLSDCLSLEAICCPWRPAHTNRRQGSSRDNSIKLQAHNYSHKSTTTGFCWRLTSSDVRSIAAPTLVEWFSIAVSSQALS